MKICQWTICYNYVMKASLHHLKKIISTPEFLKILTLRTIGNFLVLSSLFMIGKTFSQPIYEETRYFVEQQAHKQYLVTGAQETNEIHSPIADSITKRESNLLASILKIPPVEVLNPVDPYFSIVIPKIGANAKVVPNVNPANEKEYLEVLKHGVAQAAGTAYPGEDGHIFLFAHSTDYIWNVGTYNAVFYLLYKLEVGDEVDLFYQGKRHIYKVTGKEVINPSQVEYLTRTTNKEFLTLQTCWPPGTTLQRLLVFATPISQ